MAIATGLARHAAMVKLRPMRALNPVREATMCAVDHPANRKMITPRARSEEAEHGDQGPSTVRPLTGLWMALEGGSRTEPPIQQKSIWLRPRAVHRWPRDPILRAPGVEPPEARPFPEAACVRRCS